MLKVVSYQKYQELKDFFNDGKFGIADAQLIEDDPNIILNIALGSDLFNKTGNYYFYYRQDFLKEIGDLVYFWDSLIDSPHNFWVIKGDKDLELLKSDQKEYEKIDLFKNKSAEKTLEKKSYDLANAFTAGDKKRAWLLLDTHQKKGDPVEMIFFSLWWQVRILYSVMVAGNESGHNSYTISNASTVIKKNGKEKIIKWKNDLANIYYNRHITELDLYTLLKKFILES